MNQLKPQFRPDPNDLAGGLMNASAMIELARRTQTPQARQFLALYHEHESRIAAENPLLKEESIRARAVIEAMKSMGKRVTANGVPI